MHRAFQPITPSTNKLLKQKWDEQYFDEHRRKVASAKPMVDSKPPRTYMHLHLKLKKLQVEEERLATIERDNRILLEKMSQIMKTKGRVDNWNGYQPKSLNRTKRQQELLRVTHENQGILKRVLAQEPVYDRRKWEDDWHEKEAYMESISRYPKDWYKTTSSKKKSPRKKTGLKQEKEIKGERSKRRDAEDREEKEERVDVEDGDPIRYNEYRKETTSESEDQQSPVAGDGKPDSQEIQDDGKPDSHEKPDEKPDSHEKPDEKPHSQEIQDDGKPDSQEIQEGGKPDSHEKPNEKPDSQEIQEGKSDSQAIEEDNKKTVSQEIQDDEKPVSQVKSDDENSNVREIPDEKPDSEVVQDDE